MPFVIHKIYGKPLYQVINTQTGKIHSKGTTLINAKKQLKLLHIKTGEGLEALIYGRNYYPPELNKRLQDLGNLDVINMIIVRIPLPKIYDILTYYVTSGKFNLQNPYDTLYHLGLVLTLSNGQYIFLDKGQFGVRIKDYDSSKDKDGTQFLEVQMNQPIALNELIDKTALKMGWRNFNDYDVVNVNCQNFVINLLRENGLNNKENEIFVVQDIQQIFQNLDYLKYMINFGASLTEKGNILWHGEGVKKRKC